MRGNLYYISAKWLAGFCPSPESFPSEESLSLVEERVWGQDLIQVTVCFWLLSLPRVHSEKENRKESGIRGKLFSPAKKGTQMPVNLRQKLQPKINLRLLLGRI